MKKILLAFGLLSLMFTFIPPEVEASQYSYWQYWQKKYLNPTRTSSSLSKTKKTSNYKYKSNTSSRRSSGYRVYPTRSQRYTTNTASVKITTRPYSVDSVTEIDRTPIKILQVGFSNPKSYNSNTFQEAVLIQKVGFEMTDISGLGLKSDDFELVVSGENFTEQSFEFEKDGQVTLKFNNFRLTSGESLYLDFSIRVVDPDTTPHKDGRFRVKLTDVMAQTESSQKTRDTFVSGRSVSNYVSFNPTPQTSGGSTVGGTSRQIYSRTLSAGEKAYVLSMNLSAHLDDFLVEKITVKNVYGNAVDSLVKKLNLIDFSTGKIIDQTRFINGQATFNVPRDAIRVDRNQQVSLGFQAVIAETIRSNSDSRFKLTIDDSDIVIFGLGAGRYLPDSEKYVTLDNRDFFVAQNAGGGVSSSVNQPSFVSNGSLEEMYRFIIRNNGSREISVGRISLDVFLSGVAFPGGVSTDDFELREMYRGQAAPAQTFSTTGVNGSRVTFDATREIYIDGKGEKEFVLKLALNNIASNSDEHDSINVKVLGDSSLKKGILTSVRSQSPAFIWSDHSGHPHTSESGDWFSGYLFPGLPSSNHVQHRR